MRLSNLNPKHKKMELIEGKAKGLFLGIVLFFVLLEIIWAYKKQKSVYNWKEVLTNMGIMLGNQLIKPLRLAWTVFIFSWIEQQAWFALPQTIGTTLLAIILVDFLF